MKVLQRVLRRQATGNLLDSVDSKAVVKGWITKVSQTRVINTVIPICTLFYQNTFFLMEFSANTWHENMLFYLLGEKWSHQALLVCTAWSTFSVLQITWGQGG